MNATKDETGAPEALRDTLVAVACYTLWGLCPLYWKLLDGMSSWELIGHRIVWCLAFMLALCAMLRQDWRALVHDKRALRFLIPAGLVNTFSWSAYILVVAAGKLVECSLGYYINPLLSILVGVVAFGERLTPLRAVAAACAFVGVGLFIADYGQIPWYGIGLGVTFALYAAIKKKGGYPALPSIVVENFTALPAAAVFIVGAWLATGSHAFLGDVASWQGWAATLLILGAGPVTAVPLALFARAANKVPLVTLGFVQYITPSIALLLGVLVYHEEFGPARLGCFALIWLGIMLVCIDGALRAGKVAARQ